MSLLVYPQFPCICTIPAPFLRSLHRLLIAQHLIFEELHVVATESRYKDDGRDVIKALDPFATLRALPTHVEHTIYQILVAEARLDDTSGAHTRAQHILRGGHVTGLGNPIDAVKIVFSRVIELVFARSSKAFLGSTGKQGQQTPRNRVEKKRWKRFWQIINCLPCTATKGSLRLYSIYHLQTRPSALQPFAEHVRNAPGQVFI